MKPLTNIELERYASDIPHFRGVFMRDTLPKRIRKNERGIINLDSSKNQGSHWISYARVQKTKNSKPIVYYFDSFGDLKPTSEMVKYFKSNGKDVDIKYNHKQYQSYGTSNCGQLCLKFLRSV